MVEALEATRHETGKAHANCRLLLMQVNLEMKLRERLWWKGKQAHVALW